MCSMQRDGAAVARQTHNLEVDSSNLSPATSRPGLEIEMLRLGRLHESDGSLDPGLEFVLGHPESDFLTAKKCLVEVSDIGTESCCR